MSSDKRRGGQRAARDDHRQGVAAGRRNAIDLVANDRDERMRGDGRGHAFREAIPVDGERRTGRHAAGVGDTHDEGAEPPHFLLEEADRVVDLVAAKRVTADQLGEAVGLVHRRRPDGPHLVQHDGGAARGRLPGGLSARKPATYDVDHVETAGSSGVGRAGSRGVRRAEGKGQGAKARDEGTRPKERRRTLATLNFRAFIPFLCPLPYALCPFRRCNQAVTSSSERL